MSAIQPSDASRRRDRIKLLLETMVDTKEKVLVLISEAKEQDDHVALGFRSWTEYVSTEYAELLADLNREDRRFAAFALSQTGMSTRAIAPIVGVSKDTVQRDLAGVSDETPAEPMPESLRAAMSVVDTMMSAVEDKFVTGIDGKTYTRQPRVERQKPRRKPLPDAFWDACDRLNRVGTTLENLHKDDRFPQHQGHLRKKHRADLFRAQTILRKLIADLGDDEGVLL